MILYAFVAALTIAMACMVRRTNENTVTTRGQLINKIFLAAIFGVLFLLCALRIDVGNDYNTYIQNAHEVYVGGINVTEPGYNLVVKALYGIWGEENYLLLFGFFGFFTVLIYLAAMYEESEHFAISFFLFMTLGIYFRSFTTVRYYFALAVTLYSLKYVIKKDYAKFIVLIVLAALFHKSVLVVIPMYIICNRKWPKWFYAIIGVGATGLYIFKDLVMKIGLKIYPTYKNTMYLTENIGLKENIPSIARCVAVLALCIFCYKEAIKDDKSNTLFFNMNNMAIALYVGGSFLPMVSRFGYYLITAQIFLLPGIYMKLEGKKKKYVLYGILAFGGIYFLYFLKTAYNYGISVLPYKCCLFDTMEWNNVEEMLKYSNR